MPILVSVAVQKWNWCGVAGFNSVATTRPIGVSSVLRITSRFVGDGRRATLADGAEPGSAGTTLRHEWDKVTGRSVRQVLRAGRARPATIPRAPQPGSLDPRPGPFRPGSSRSADRALPRARVADTTNRPRCAHAR